jgi:RimJ/RimL family protein N-acetyltransferase
MDGDDIDSILDVPGETRLHVRALGPNEEQPIRDLLARLSMQTRYLRFLSPMATVPESLVRLLAAADGDRRLSLIVEREDHDGREPIALGSLAAVDGNARAEIALVVRDDWQHHGVGTALARRMLDAAARLGYQTFVALVHSQNVAIRRLLAHVGTVVSARSGGGASELIFVPLPRLLAGSAARTPAGR